MGKTGPVAAFLVLFLAIPAARAADDIVEGSQEYQRIIDAVEILEAAGGDPAEPPSPAWMAQNIRNYLAAGKIQSRTSPGAYGSNTSSGGPVYIHWGHFVSEIGPSFDPDTEIGFKNLVVLAQTLAHEKYHSENHGDFERFFWTNECESEAYLHEIEFLDQLALRMAEHCNAIPNDEPGRKLKCLKRLRIVYRSKQNLIRAYNASKYARAGEPVDDVLVGVIDDVVEQLDHVIPRWEELAEEAGEASDDEMGLLLDEFLREHGEAETDFYAQVREGEHRMLTAVGEQRAAVTATVRAGAARAATALGGVAADLSDDAGNPPFVVLVTIEAGDGLLHDAGLHRIPVLRADGSWTPARLEETRAPIRAVLRGKAEDLGGIVAAPDPVAAARELRRAGALTVSALAIAPPATAGWMPWALVALGLLSVVLLVLLIRAHGR